MNSAAAGGHPTSTLHRWAASPWVTRLPFLAEEFAPPKLSFEFFPPRTEALEQQLWACIRRLEPLDPCFVSVTYGAGGSARARTHATVERVLRETRLIPAAHLTCVGASRGEVDEVARQYWAAGVRHIVALRGDPPQGTTYVSHPDGYPFASDLVVGLKRVADFEISVAAYPESHPQALSEAADLDYLRRKLDAGATRAITQFFFDHECYLRFLDRCLAIGITAPIVPGILPVTNFAQAQRMAGTCGARVPAWLLRLFEDTAEDAELRRMIAAIVAAEQVRILQAKGIDEFHIYTLNRPDLTAAIAHILGVRAAGAAR